MKYKYYGPISEKQLKDEENWSYPDFESVMEATFLDGKPFRDLLPDLDWY